MIFISVFDHWQENTPVMSLQLELNRENCAACFTVWNSVNAANPSPAHLLWMSPDIFFIHLQKYFKSLVLFTAGGSHGPQQFSGENILLHTEVWLCSMSRELSVWLYFRTYLQTTMKGLFCLMHIFPLERHVKRFRDCPEDSTNLFFTFHIVCSHTVDHRSTVCKPCKLKPSVFFFTLYWKGNRSPQLMITHISKSTLSIARYWLCWAHAIDAHTLWRIRGGVIYHHSKIYEPIKHCLPWGRMTLSRERNMALCLDI